MGRNVDVQRRGVFAPETGSRVGRHVVEHGTVHAQRLGQTHLFVVQSLRVGAYVQLDPVVIGGAAARFHYRSLAVGVTDVALFHNDVGVGKPLIDITELVVIVRYFFTEQAGFGVPILQFGVMGPIVQIGLPLEHLGRVGLHGLVHIQHERLALVLHFDEAGGPFGQIAAFGHHGGHQIAHVVDGAAEHRGIIFMGHDQMHALERPRGVRVQADDIGLGMGTAQDKHVQHVFKTDVRVIPGLARHPGTAVLLPHLAAHSRLRHACRFHVSNLPPSSVPGLSTRRSKYARNCRTRRCSRPTPL